MVDVKVCFGCRQGISTFSLHDDGKFYHVDLFATREAGAMYHCENSKELAPYLNRNGNPPSKTYLANPELDAFYREQGHWWQDAIQLAHDVIKEEEKVLDFFMNDKENSILYKWSNDQIETALLALAVNNKIEVKQEDYPDLLIWKK